MPPRHQPAGGDRRQRTAATRCMFCVTSPASPDRHVVGALQERRRPEHQSPAPQRAHRAADHQVHTRSAATTGTACVSTKEGDSPSSSPSRQPRLGSRTVSHTPRPASDPGDAEREEHRAPAVVVGDGAGDVVANPGADRRAEGEHRERHGAPAGREIVRQQRVRPGRAAGLADRHPDAREEELQRRCARDRTAPSSPTTAPGRRRDDLAAAAAIDEPRERKAEHDVEEAERPRR